MTVGAGIFLSILFLVTVMVFLFSKDKTKWKKYFKIGILVIGVAVTAIGGYIGFQEWSSNRPQIATSLWGINLTDKKDDVVFKKGKASFVVENSGNWIYPAKPDETVLNSTYVIGWKGEKLHFISYEPEGGFDGIQGIYCGQSTSADIEKKFGKPSEIKNSEDHTSRLYLYPTYQMFFTLTKDRVDRFGVYNPALGQPGKENKGENTADIKQLKNTQMPIFDSKGWTQESTGSSEAGPWLNYSPPGTRYYRDASRIIYRVYPPGVKPDAEKANPFGVGDSTEDIPK